MGKKKKKEEGGVQLTCDHIHKLSRGRVQQEILGNLHKLLFSDIAHDRSNNNQTKREGIVCRGYASALWGRGTATPRK